MNKIQLAWKIAKKVHKNQKRYNGRPYINHIKEIVDLLKKMKITNNDIIISAILHDVIEDGGSEYRKIIAKEFGLYIHTNLCFLTHHRYDTYDEYIKKMLFRKDCVIIKIVDIIQNLTETPTKKQREKYRKALPLLILEMYKNVKK